MTEEDFASCTEVEQLLAFLNSRNLVSARKSRLLAVACCRRIPRLLEREPLRKALDLAETMADNEIDQGERQRVEVAALEERKKSGYLPGTLAKMTLAKKIPLSAILSRSTSYQPGREERMAEQVFLCRELFGPLAFRRPGIDGNMLTSNDGTLVALAQSIYAEYAWDRMVILADALEDAGCRDAEVLEHCRGPGPHVRGCWVVDLLLGKG